MITVYQNLYAGIWVKIRDSMNNFVYDCIVEEWDTPVEKNK